MGESDLRSDDSIFVFPGEPRNLTKVQVYQDAILRKQAGEIKDQTDTRREIVSAEKMNE
jgi:hypothetical protein